MLKHLAVIAALITPSAALTQSYPSRPITMIAPNAVSEWDVIAARYVVEKMSVALGQPILLQNRPGALGKIGLEECMRAQPDGYTICMTTYGHMNVLAADSIAAGEVPPYDPGKLLVPIGKIAEGQYLVVVGAQVPVNTLEEFVAYAKANPEKIAYATHGPSSVLVGKILKTSLGINFLEVSYGGGPGEAKAVGDLLGGSMHLYAGAVFSLKPLIDAGKIRPIAVYGGSGRSLLFPAVPTLLEKRVSAIGPIRSWSSLWAPPGTPPAITARVTSALGRALQDPDLRKAFETMAIEPGQASPAALQELQADIPELAGLLKAYGISVFGR